MNENNNKTFLDWVSNGTIIAVVPIVSYYITYKYEKGYLSYFHIPEYFISISPEIFFKVFSTLIAILLVIIFYTSWIIGSWPSKHKDKLPVFAPLIVSFLFLALFWYLHAKWITIFMLFLGFSTVIICYILPFFLKNNKAYTENVQNMLNDSTNLLIDKIFNVLGAPVYIILIIAILLLPVIANQAGEYDASNQREFSYIKYENENFALVKIYGGKVLLVSFDITNKKFRKKYLMLDSGELNKYPLEIIEVID